MGDPFKKCLGCECELPYLHVYAFCEDCMFPTPKRPDHGAKVYFTAVTILVVFFMLTVWALTGCSCSATVRNVCYFY